MKRFSISILLTLILAISSFAGSSNLTSTEVKQLQKDVIKSIGVIQDSSNSKNRISAVRVKRALGAILKTCLAIEAVGTPKAVAFAKDCTGYVNAYDLSNALVIAACYVPKPVAPKPKSKPKPNTVTFGNLNDGFSDSFEEPFYDYSDPVTSFGGGFDICGDARKRQTKAKQDMLNCLNKGSSKLKKIGDFAGCLLGVFIGRPCKTK